MSSIGVTYFCINGHIVDDIPHGYIVETPPMECPYCHSKTIKKIGEWNDYRYWIDGDINGIVNHTPTREEEVKIRVPVYDVRKLFNGKKKVKCNGL
jgi:hypothetical protein